MKRNAIFDNTISSDQNHLLAKPRFIKKNYHERTESKWETNLKNKQKNLNKIITAATLSG